MPPLNEPKISKMTISEYFGTHVFEKFVSICKKGVPREFFWFQPFRKFFLVCACLWALIFGVWGYCGVYASYYHEKFENCKSWYFM